MLVDVVEGVCTQTHNVLRQAWVENVKPVLVLNKIDRLITELRFTPLEAFVHMNKILEQINAIMGTFYTEELLEEDRRRYEEDKKSRAGKLEEETSGDWHIEFQDDDDLYFSPERGNVMFSSAIDGWAFRYELPTEYPTLSLCSVSLLGSTTLLEFTHGNWASRSTSCGECYGATFILIQRQSVY